MHVEHRYEIAVFITLAIFLFVHTFGSAFDALIVAGLFSLLLASVWWHSEVFVPSVAVILVLALSAMATVPLWVPVIALIVLTGLSGWYAEEDWHHRFAMWKEELGYYLGALGLTVGFYLASHNALIGGTLLIVVAAIAPVVVEDPHRIIVWYRELARRVRNLMRRTCLSMRE